VRQGLQGETLLALSVALTMGAVAAAGSGSACCRRIDWPAHPPRNQPRRLIETVDYTYALK